MLLCAGCAATEEPLTPLADDISIEFRVDEIQCPESVKEYHSESRWAPNPEEIVTLFFDNQPTDRQDNPVEVVFHCPAGKNGEKTNVLILSDGKQVRNEEEKQYGCLNYATIGWRESYLTDYLSTAWKESEEKGVWNAIGSWPQGKNDFIAQALLDAEAWVEKLKLPKMEVVYSGYIDTKEQYQIARMNGDDSRSFNELQPHTKDCFIIVYQPISGAYGSTMFFYTEDGLSAVESFSLGDSEPLAEYVSISLREALKPVVEKYRGNSNCAIVSAELAWKLDSDVRRYLPVWHIVLREKIPAGHDYEAQIQFITEEVNTKNGVLYDRIASPGSINASLYNAARQTLMVEEGVR